MSGGHFDYKQYQISQVADELEQLIINNDSQERDEYNQPNGLNYSNETIDEFKAGLLHLKKAAIYLQRIDWLVSGDDGEDTFHRRLLSDLKEKL